MKEFDASAGEYIPASKSKELIDNTHKEKAKRGLRKDDYTHSQFFGKDKLEALLRDAGPDCVGIRINFILEGEKNDELGALIQAVDKNGNVLHPAKQMMKTMSSGDGGGGLYGGPKCPRTCLPPPDDSPN